MLHYPGLVWSAGHFSTFWNLLLCSTKPRNLEFPTSDQRKHLLNLKTQDWDPDRDLNPEISKWHQFNMAASTIHKAAIRTFNWVILYLLCNICFRSFNTQMYSLVQSVTLTIQLAVLRTKISHLSQLVG